MGGVRIGSNIASLGVLRHLAAAGDAASRSSERLASGQRIIRAGDDAAGLAVSAALSVNTRVFSKGIQNLNDTISLTAIETSALSELSGITMRQKELAEQAANGSYSTAQRRAIDTEAAALTDEYNRIVLGTEFNGRKVFADPWDTLRAQFGVGDGNALSFKFADELSTKISPGEYLLVDSPGRGFYVWFSVDGIGSDPALSHPELQGRLGRKVDVASSESGARAETTTITAPDGTSDWTWLFISSGQKSYQVYFKNGTSPTCPALERQNQPGVDAILTVNTSSGWTPAQVAAELKNVLEATNEFSVNVSGPTATVTTVAKVDTTNANSMFVTVGTSVNGRTAPDARSLATAVGDALKPNKEDFTDWFDSNSRTWNPQTIRPTGFRSSVGQDGLLTLVSTVAGRISGSSANYTGTFLLGAQDQGAGLRQAKALDNPPLSALTLHDINNDGFLDVFGTDAGGAYSYISINNGDGTFRAAFSATAGSPTADSQRFFFADLTGDGLEDVVSTSTGVGPLTVIRNLGDGRFQQTQSFVVDPPGTVWFSDFNGDGKQDMLLGSGPWGRTYIYSGAGNGTFAATSMMSYGCTRQYTDVNGDGRPDLIGEDVSGNPFVALNNGGGSFAPIQTFSWGWATPSVADLDGNGSLDIYGVFGTTLSVLLNAGNGSFHPMVQTNVGATFVGLTDFDGDGKRDLLARSGSSVILRLGNGNGTFQAAATFTAPFNPSAVSISDLDGDGRLDALLRDGSGKVAVMSNAGGGTFTISAAYSMSQSNLQIVDVNGDGFSDLLSADGNFASVRLNSRDGTFGERTFYTMGYTIDNNKTVLKAADMNADGKTDLVAADKDGNYLSVRLADAQGNLTGANGDRSAQVNLQFFDARGMCAVNRLDLSTQSGALSALPILDNRLQRISAQLGSLGATEARLNAALIVVNASHENYMAAHGRIVDADVAVETAQLTKNRILQNIGSAILAQANLSPSLALRLIPE